MGASTAPPCAQSLQHHEESLEEHMEEKPEQSQNSNVGHAFLWGKELKLSVVSLNPATREGPSTEQDFHPKHSRER